MLRALRGLAFFVAFGGTFGVVGSVASATHNHVDDNFDNGLSGGWSGAPLTADPAGGFYLGTLGAQSVGYFIMDGLPALNDDTGDIDSHARLLKISFDLVTPVSPGPLDRFTLSRNGELLWSQFGFQLSPLAGRNHFEVYSTLTTVDTFVTFGKQGTSSAWGLDNVSINWAHAVPEPSTWSLGLTAIGLGGAGAYRRRRLARRQSMTRVATKTVSLRPRPDAFRRSVRAAPAGGRRIS